MPDGIGLPLHLARHEIQHRAFDDGPALEGGRVRELASFQAVGQGRDFVRPAVHVGQAVAHVVMEPQVDLRRGGPDQAARYRIDPQHEQRREKQDKSIAPPMSSPRFVKEQPAYQDYYEQWERENQAVDEEGGEGDVFHFGPGGERAKAIPNWLNSSI